MFSIWIQYKNEPECMYENVYEISFCDNEDGKQVLIFFNDDSGIRFPYETLKQIKVIPMP